MSYTLIAHTQLLRMLWIGFFGAHFLRSAVVSEVIESCCAHILLTIVETECHVLIEVFLAILSLHAAGVPFLVVAFSWANSKCLMLGYIDVMVCN